MYRGIEACLLTPNLHSILNQINSLSCESIVIQELLTTNRLQYVYGTHLPYQLLHIKTNIGECNCLPQLFIQILFGGIVWQINPIKASTEVEERKRVC
jgi:hypothetical protein